MTTSRIYLADEDDETYSEETNNFHRMPVVKVRAEDREEAREIAEHVADKFGEKIRFD